MFDDLNKAKKKLTPHSVNGKVVGEARKYIQANRGTEGDVAKEEDIIIPSRTLPPTKPIVYGATKYPYADIPGPYLLESKPVKDYGRHRPVWEGWRPARPETSYAELGSKMPVPSRNYKYETDVPGEDEMVDMADRNTSRPYPAVPEGEEIPDVYREYGMYAEEGSENMSGLSDMGQIPTQVTSLAKDIAATIQAKYGAQIEKYKAQQSGITLPGAPSPFKPESKFPLGTVALVAGLGLAAVFLLPKILK